LPTAFDDLSLLLDALAPDTAGAWLPHADDLVTDLTTGGAHTANQAVLFAPRAPRAPADLPGASVPSPAGIATSAGGSNNAPRFDWPSASLPMGLLGLLALGALLLLAVTEASPRTWQFRPYTPPA
jgi:hypothetical protein